MKNLRKSHLVQDTNRVFQATLYEVPQLLPGNLSILVSLRKVASFFGVFWQFHFINLVSCQCFGFVFPFCETAL